VRAPRGINIITSKIAGKIRLKVKRRKKVEIAPSSNN
jgi:hypothetical protein